MLLSMDLPADLFVKPVDGDADIHAFRYGFELDGKSLSDAIVQETEDGDLIIEGYAASFSGIDRHGENFSEGAFQEGIRSFLSGSASLCYHHRHGSVLGKVLDLQEEEGKGLKMTARVDGAVKNDPTLGTIYSQIKRGSISGLSVGGFFKRAMTPAGPRIVDVDFTEVSVTPVPVHPGTSFAVVAGKALEDLKIPDVPAIDGDIREEDLFQIGYLVDDLTRVFDRISKRGGGSAAATDTQSNPVG